MKRTSKILLATIAMAFALSACGKKKNDDQAAVSAARETRANTNTDGVLPSGNAYQPGSEVTVEMEDSQAAVFNQNIKVLVSATMNPEDVGNVDNRNGVKLRGEIGLNCGAGANGSLKAADSKIQLTITDDKRDSEGNLYQPIVIKVVGSSGSINNGNVNLVFADDYGSITLTGYISGSTYTGNVNFQNTKAYNGRSSGTLGRFVIPSNNIFICK